MIYLWTVVEGIFPVTGTIYILIAHHEVAGFNVALQAAGSTRADEKAYAKSFHRPYIRPIVDGVWRNGMVAPMSRKKGYSTIREGGKEDTIAWRAERSIHSDLLYLVKERVKTAAAEDPDLRGRGCVIRRHPTVKSSSKSMG